MAVTTQPAARTSPQASGTTSMTLRWAAAPSLRLSALPPTSFSIGNAKRAPAHQSEQRIGSETSQKSIESWLHSLNDDMKDWKRWQIIFQAPKQHTTNLDYNKPSTTAGGWNDKPEKERYFEKRRDWLSQVISVCLYVWWERYEMNYHRSYREKK